MDDRRLADFARKQGGVVTAAQLGACGLSPSGVRHRVRAGRLFRVRHSAYALSPHQDPRSGLWAAVLTVGIARTALSHWSAIHLHGMAAGMRVSSLVHVTVPGSRGRKNPGLQIHATRSLPAHEVVMIGGLPVTTPPRSVLDVAVRGSDRTVARLIREGEYLGLLPAGAMRRVVDAHPRHPGAARIRRVDPATAEESLRQTPLEDELDALLRTLPLPPAERQIEVRGISGALYRLDFGWSAMRVAAEADGRPAHERASSMHTDRFRDNDLAAVGWQTMRFTRRQIISGAADARTQIFATVTSRGGLPAP